MLRLYIIINVIMCSFYGCTYIYNTYYILQHTTQHIIFAALVTHPFYMCVELNEEEEEKKIAIVIEDQEYKLVYLTIILNRIFII